MEEVIHNLVLSHLFEGIWTKIDSYHSPLISPVGSSNENIVSCDSSTEENDVK
jgi:hypothetical protein